MALVQQRNVHIEHQKYYVLLNVIHQKRNYVRMSTLIIVLLKFKRNQVDVIYIQKNLKGKIKIQFLLGQLQI